MGFYTDAAHTSDVYTGLMREINALENVWVSSATTADAGCITVDSDNLVHVAVGSTINVYDANGVPQFAYSVTGVLVGFGGTGHIYTWTVASVTIRRYTKAGVFVDSFTLPAGSHSIHPSVDVDDKLYAIIGDTIYQYNASNGSEIATGTFTTGEDDIPGALGTDYSGNIWVATYGDPGNIIKRFNTSMTVTQTTDVTADIGAAGQGSNQAVFSDGTEIALAYNVTVLRIYNSSGTRQHTGTVNAYNDLDIGSVFGLSAGGKIFVCYDSGPGSRHGIKRLDFNLTEEESWNVFVLTNLGLSQTVWYKYPTISLADKVSLGTPDGGVSIPALNALVDLDPRSNYFTDMRAAIQAVAPYYLNAVTGNAFNWTASSADNLYHVAVTPSTYTWQASEAEGAVLDEDLFQEILSCVLKLQDSDVI